MSEWVKSKGHLRNSLSKNWKSFQFGEKKSICAPLSELRVITRISVLSHPSNMFFLVITYFTSYIKVPSPNLPFRTLVGNLLL